MQFIGPNTKELKIGLLEKQDSVRVVHIRRKSLQTLSKAKTAENVGKAENNTVSQTSQSINEKVGSTYIDNINALVNIDDTKNDNVILDESDGVSTIGISTAKPIVENDSLKFEMGKRYLLDDCDSQDYTKQMTPSPGMLMILSLYFITLEYNGEYYVVLDYTSYVQSDYNDGYAVNNGMWTVPHTSIFVDTGRIKPTTIKEIKDEYEKFMAQSRNQDRMTKAQEDLLYSLGFLNGEAHTPYKGWEYIEYKESHTITKEMRCFFIREFFHSRHQ